MTKSNVNKNCERLCPSHVRQIFISNFVNIEDNNSHIPTLLHYLIRLGLLFALFGLRDPYWQKLHLTKM